MRCFRTSLSVAAVALAIALAGCSTAATSSTVHRHTGTTGTSTGTTAAGSHGRTRIAEDTHYDSDDLTWDAATEVAVSLSDGASKVTSSSSTGVAVDGDTVTISAAGTYRLSGSLSDGQIVVAAGEEDTVRIILDGAELASSTGSPFVVQSADEAIVYLADGTHQHVDRCHHLRRSGRGRPQRGPLLHGRPDHRRHGHPSPSTASTTTASSSKDGLVLAARQGHRGRGGRRHRGQGLHGAAGRRLPGNRG